MRAACITFVAAVAFLSSACGDSPRADTKAETKKADAKKADVSFGEPSLVRMEGEGKASYEMAIAVSVGTALDKVIEPLTARLHKAIEGCPAVLEDLAGDRVVALRFRVEAGPARVVGDDGSPSQQCLGAALTRTGIDTRESFDVLVQLRKPRGSP